MIKIDEMQYGCQTMEDCEIVFKQMDQAKVITIDTETSGLDWKHNHTVGHVLKCLGLPSYYIPVRHLGGGNIPGCSIPQEAVDGWKGDLHPFEREFAKRYRDQPKHWVGQNLIFDMRFEHRLGIELYGTFEDTQLNAPLIDENQFSFSLEAIAKWLDLRPKVVEIYEYLAEQFGGEPVKSQMSNWWRTDASVPIVLDYATGDGLTTEEAYLAQQPILDADDLRRVHNVECRLIKTLYRMTTGGIRIDEDELRRVDRSFESQIATMAAQFPPNFNSSAPTQLRELFKDYIEQGNWPRRAVTPLQAKKAKEKGVEAIGALSFDEKALLAVPEGQAIINMRKMEHARNSFTIPMLERHMWNGRVHTEFNQMKADEYGTISGRLSSSAPNLQQVPKRNKVISKPYRRAFLPDEGHIWFDNDYAQQEYVVFTDYTRDPTLVAGYNANPPVDIHQSVADLLSVERDPTAKRMNLGMLYGMGKDKMAAALGVSLEQAIEWINLYHERIPSARQFLKNAEKRARARGFVFTYLGRRRHFPDVRFAHKAGNAVIQGSSADITKAKMCEIDEYFQSEGDIFRLMLQCHDSLSWSGPEDRPDINAEAVRIMQDFSEGQAIEIGVPLRVDSGMGANWSIATFGA